MRRFRVLSFNACSHGVNSERKQSFCRVESKRVQKKTKKTKKKKQRRRRDFWRTKIKGKGKIGKRGGKGYAT